MCPICYDYAYIPFGKIDDPTPQCTLLHRFNVTEDSEAFDA